MLNIKKSKALGSYLCLAAALLALVTAIVFLATQAEAAPLGHDGVQPGMILLAGVVVAAILFVVPLRFGALIQVIIYNIALYFMVVQLYFVFADVINNVTYAGGNAKLCVFYMAATLVVCLLSIVACFFPQTKDGDESAKAEKKNAVVSLAPAGVLAVAALVSLIVFLPKDAGTPGGPGNVGPSSGSEPFKLSYADNTFVGKSIEELGAIPRETWEAKEANGEVAYFFEGQYTEGFATIVDPACLDMYLCKDGSMYGSISGPSTSVSSGVTYVYGYWYNYDESGEYNFVIHLTGNQNLDGSTVPTNVAGGADADVFVFDTDHGAYNWEASLSYGLYGGMMTRNINIYGQQYAPATSLSVDASGLKVFYTGDSLDVTPLAATAVRANGSSESIWNGRIMYRGYDPSTPGKQTVTASFLGASTTFEVTVEPLVTERYSGTYDLVVDGTPTPTEATLRVDYSHKICSVTGANGFPSISGTVVEAGDSKLVLILNGSEPLEILISGTGNSKQVTIPAHKEVVSSSTETNEYDIGEATLNLVG